MISGVFWKLAGKKLTLTAIVAETGPLRQTHNSHIAAGEAKEGLDYLFIAAHKISINVSSSFDQNRIISLSTQLNKEISNCLWEMCLLPNITWKHGESGKSKKSKLKAISQFSRESMISQSTVFGSDKWLNEGNSIQTFGDEHDNPLFGSNPKKYWTFHPLGAAVTRMNRRGL